MSMLNSIREDDWTAQWAITAGNKSSFKTYHYSYLIGGGIEYCRSIVTEGFELKISIISCTNRNKIA